MIYSHRPTLLLPTNPPHTQLCPHVISDSEPRNQVVGATSQSSNVILPCLVNIHSNDMENTQRKTQVFTTPCSLGQTPDSSPILRNKKTNYTEVLHIIHIFFAIFSVRDALQHRKHPPTKRKKQNKTVNHVDVQPVWELACRCMPYLPHSDLKLY